MKLKNLPLMPVRRKTIESQDSIYIYSSLWVVNNISEGGRGIGRRGSPG